MVTPWYLKYIGTEEEKTSHLLYVVGFTWGNFQRQDLLRDMLPDHLKADILREDGTVKDVG
jgi:hypothetical protein